MPLGSCPCHPDTGPPSRGSHLLSFAGHCGSLIPGIGIALLRKCPACLVAYAGIFSSAGLVLDLKPWAVHGLLIGALLIHVVYLAVRVAQHRVDMSLLASSCALVLILLGKYLWDSSLLVSFGLGGMLCLAFWNAGRWTARELSTSLKKSRIHGSSLELGLKSPE